MYAALTVYRYSFDTLTTCHLHTRQGCHVQARGRQADAQTHQAGEDAVPTITPFAPPARTTALAIISLPIAIICTQVFPKMLKKSLETLSIPRRGDVLALSSSFGREWINFFIRHRWAAKHHSHPHTDVHAFHQCAQCSMHTCHAHMYSHAQTSRSYPSIFCGSEQNRF